MTVHVKYFASLRETMGRAQDEITLDNDSSTVEDIWNQATQNLSRPDNILVAVNHEYSSLSQEIHDGDEVAFFPPVTGG